jgi:hypothetical protein
VKTIRKYAEGTKKVTSKLKCVIALAIKKMATGSADAARGREYPRRAPNDW